MTPQLTNIKGKAGVQAVVNPGFGQGPAIVTRNYRSSASRCRSTRATASPRRSSSTSPGPPPRACGCRPRRCWSPTSSPTATRRSRWSTGYKRRLQQHARQPVSTFGGHAYDGLMILVEAIKRAGSFDKAKVRDEIEKTKGFIGTGGVVNMSPTDHMGLDLTAFRMLEIKNGDWTLVAVATSSAWRVATSAPARILSHLELDACPSSCNSLFSGLTVGAGLRAGRARLHDDLQRLRRRQLRPGRVRDARRHDDRVRSASPACRCRSRPARDRGHGRASGLRSTARDRARARRQRRGADHHHHRRLDLPARRRPGDVRQALPPPAAAVRRRADPCRRRRHPAAELWSCSPAPSSIVVLLWAVLRPHAARQGDARDCGQPAGGAARRHQHPPRSSALSFALSAAIGALAGVLDHADHAHQLRRRHAAGAQGLRRRDARRHGQPDRRGGRRAASSACSRPSPRATSRSQLQGRRRLHGHPAACCSSMPRGLFGKAAAERV